MKLLLIAAIAVLPCLCFAQFEDELWKGDTSLRIPDKAKVIYVKNSDFKKACVALLDAGFEIENKDADIGTIQTRLTAPKSYFGTEWEPVIDVRVKDSITVIKGKFMSSVWKEYQEGFYRQNKKGIPKKDAYTYAFIRALRVALSLGKEISYSK